MSCDQVVVSEAGDSITIFVSVLDRHSGTPVEGIAGFTVAVDGTPVAVEAVEPVADSEAGVAVLIMLDVSGSMRGEPIAQARAAAEALVEQPSDQDVAAVLPFADSVPGDVEFTSSRDELVRAIQAVSTAGETGTALYDAVVQGIGAVEGAAVPRRAVVLLTDGQESGDLSEHTRDDTLQAAAAAGIPIFAVGLGEDADKDFLSRLAQSSGGAWYYAPSPAQVRAIFDDIGAKLRSQYAVTAELPASEDADRELTVTTDLDGTIVSAEASFQAPAAQPGPAAGDGGLPPLLWLMVVAVVVAVVAVIAISIRRRGRTGRVLAGGPGQNVSVPAQIDDLSQQVPAPLGRLRVIEGPNAGTSVVVATEPVDIGTDPDCGLRLDSAGGAVASRHARVWAQSGGFILHHLARGRETLVGDKQVEWISLEADDKLRIGPHVIGFSRDA